MEERKKFFFGGGFKQSPKRGSTFPRQPNPTVQTTGISDHEYECEIFETEYCFQNILHVYVHVKNVFIAVSNP